MSGFWRESDVSASDDSDADNSPDGGDRSVAGKSTLEDLSSRKIVGDEIEPQNVGRGITAAKWLSGSWPLKSFDENLPLNKRKAEWIRFRNQFERIVACKEPVGSTMKLDGLKIFAGNYLLSVIEAHGNLPADSGNIYDATVSALNRYFEQTCDCTKERMKFREMRMGTSEPFVDWVLRLETQAKFCEFEADQRVEEFIQALVRRSVPQIATKLYEMSDVFNNNLERITAYGRHLDYIRTEAEESKHITKDESGNRMDEMNSHEGTVVKPVNAVAGRSSAFGQIRQGFHREVRSDADGNRFSSGRAGRFKNVSQSCSRCGSIHGPKKCLAYRVKCYTCGREGHFAAFCFFKDGSANGGPRGGHWRSGRDRMVKQEVERINQLITRRSCNSLREEDPRQVCCKIGTESVDFLIDTGATVNTITTAVWETIKSNCRSVIQDFVLFPEEVLRSYANQQPLEVACSFKAYIAVNNRPLQLAKFFVVKGTNLSLLSYETASNLNLIRIGLQVPPITDSGTRFNEVLYSLSDTRLDPRMLDITVARENEPQEFPKIPIAAVKFKVDDAVSPKQIIRYNIPKAFESATNEKLRRMERRGIIERADKERDIITYVSPLVLVPKGGNDFRIVVDYREVNKAILREPYPLPSLDKIWTDIPNGTMYFSKLDLKDAFFHIELHDEVRHFTTFMTANGLMRFKRLPFGLSCAPELFQKVMERLLVNCKNIIIYLDDVLVHGNSLSELRQNVDMVGNSPD
ncbi:uncharacterized protein LOC129777483 isoform X1 [Toxorhynchites rutilus septentrionalis]|uniref:uncharacterized protein LOC129777483 isoform X1 n=1 Tax=Toxorhynchites rutilus septentrionalis TaxID=329112 RepID=UPI00247A1CDC|nr:uncharacterized protein LOC129777483 isoform X1 [Toxorhynchites rutilus septentrionalis]